MGRAATKEPVLYTEPQQYHGYPPLKKICNTQQGQTICRCQNSKPTMLKVISSLCIVILISVSSCKFVQVVTVTGDNMKLEKHLVYENDSVKVIYDLWTNQGILAFSIYNKMNRPIYIDWKKCSFILDNSKKLDYFVDFEKSDQVTYYDGYLFRNLLGKIGSSSVGIGSQTTVKSERITFIPPRSFIVSRKFKLTTGQYKLLNPTEELVPKSWRPNSKKKTKIKTLVFKNQVESPERFRNFLTFSTSEKFETEFYVENSLWVSQIMEMKRIQFLGPNRNGSVYRRADRFYHYSNASPDEDIVE